MLGQQADGMGELALAGVDAADEDVQDQIAQLVVGQPIACLFGSDQRRDQLVAGSGAAGRDQLVLIGVELRHGAARHRPKRRRGRASTRAARWWAAPSPRCWPCSFRRW